jgi:hypothetical protein
MRSRRFGAALLRSVAAILCVAATTLACGQVPADVVIEGKEPALRCLIVPSHAIEYPPDAETFKTDGVVRVQLTFSGGEDRPRAEVFYSSSEEFRALVLGHVRDYRMPCLERGESRVVTQEFQFVPDDRRAILSGAPRAAHSRTLGCLKTTEPFPVYPRLDSRSDVTHGRVLARAEFTAPDAPPQVEIVFNGGNDRFERAVRAYMSGYRLPCLQASDLPLVMTQPFHFLLQGERATLLKDSTLASFVRNVANLENQHVRFDFATMGCPFDLNFVLWQPHAKNVVREIERSDPNRREFIEWLRGVDLNAAKKLHDEIVGDSMTISVPCGVLDLL